jgi:hypothetical protein
MFRTADVLFVAELDGRVCTIAEGFVLRLAAPAQCHTVADFVSKTIRSVDRYAPA